MSIFETLHYINGNQIRPVNADQIGFKLDWTGDIREAELTVDSIILANKARQLVLDHIDQLGVFEGLPYTVTVGSLTLNYYIDLTDNPIISGFGDSEIEVTIKRRNATDFFLTQADALSFSAINKTNPINLVEIPYLIVKDNQLEMLIILSISTYTLVKALIEGIQALVQATTDFLKIVSVGPVVNVGQILSAALLLVARFIYVAALIIALIDLTKQIIELIFPPLRYLKAATIIELMTKGCQKLGFQFSSTLLDSIPHMTVLPAPLTKEKKSIFTNLFTLDNGSYTKGYPTARDTVSTLGRLIDSCENMFNSTIRITNGVVNLERRDFWQDNAGLQIQRTLTLQNERENRWRYNLGEAWKRYYIHYRTDVADLNTMDRLDKSDVEYSTEPVSVVNADLVSIKGLVDLDTQFALGARKEELTLIEKAALPLAILSDEVVQSFGGSSSLESKIKGRVGVLQLSQQYFSVTKMLYSIGGRQPANYRDILGAPNLWDKYHYINQVKENFKKIYSSPIPFSTSNFEMLLENNYVYDQDGKPLEILTFEWINETKSADIEYSEHSIEGFNTKTILISG
tara:strand:+ start:2388 stop:4106 length:1719 start_codon:yes stop_codon:yes gene_type:complete